jgi:hypothetical protein
MFERRVPALLAFDRRTDVATRLITQQGLLESGVDWALLLGT